MNLEEQLKDVSAKLSELNIPIFYSDDILTKDLLVSDRELMPTSSIVDFVKSISASFVVISILRLEIDEDFTLDYVSEDFDAKRYSELKKELAPFAGTIRYFALYVLHDKSTLCFPFYHVKDVIIEEFIELEDELEDQQDATDEFDDDGNPIIPYKKLSKKEIQDYAEKILADSEYLRIATIDKRQHYLYEFFDSELDNTNCYEIHVRAEMLFEKHIRNKVQELKATGMKKVNVMSELGISKGRVDKYY